MQRADVRRHLGQRLRAQPLLLQDHSQPDVKETFMRFRNVWYRPLED